MRTQKPSIECLHRRYGRHTSVQANVRLSGTFTYAQAEFEKKINIDRYRLVEINISHGLAVTKMVGLSFYRISRPSTQR